MFTATADANAFAVFHRLLLRSSTQTYLALFIHALEDDREAIIARAA